MEVKDTLIEGHSEFVRLSNISPTPIMMVELRNYETNELLDKYIIQDEAQK